MDRFSNFNGLKVLILGCGWSGKAVGKAFSEAGASVIGTTRSVENFEKIEQLGIEPTTFDAENVFESSFSEKSSSLFDVDVVIVTLSPRGISQIGDPAKVHSRIAQLIAAGSAKHVIYMGSTGVYSDAPKDYIEDEAIHRVSRHSQTDLLAIEKAYHENSFTLSVLRCGGLIGADRWMQRVVSSGREITGSKGVLNLTHQRDVVNAMIWVVEKERSTGTFNLVSPYHPTKEEFYIMVAKEFGLSVPKFDGKDLGRRTINIDRISNEGYRFFLENPSQLFLS